MRDMNRALGNALNRYLTTFTEEPEWRQDADKDEDEDERLTGGPWLANEHSRLVRQRRHTTTTNKETKNVTATTWDARTNALNARNKARHDACAANDALEKALIQALDARATREALDAEWDANYTDDGAA